MYKKMKEEIIYDKIYLGGSLSILIKTYFEKKNVAVIEKENFLGGAWKRGYGKQENVDLACHLIVPSSNENSKKISNFFKKFKLRVRKVFTKEFYTDSDSWQSYGKKGPAMICNEGWPQMLNVFQKLIEKKKNVKIIKNCNVLKLLVNDNLVKLITSKKNYVSKKVYFPSYFSLKCFYLNKKKILLPGKKINNYHFLIKIKCETEILLKNFQCFFSKKNDDLFDRVSVSSAKNIFGQSDFILTARLGKKYKKNYKKINKNQIQSFLIKKKLVKKILNINFEIIEYKCYYRDICDRIISKNNLKKSNGKVIWLNTTYFGNFISSFFK